MTPRQVAYLRPGTELRVTDPLLGSVHARLERFDRGTGRVVVRRFDLAAGDFEADARAIPPADVIERHRRF